MTFHHIAPVSKSEHRLAHVLRDEAGNLDHILIKAAAHEVKVAEEKRLFDVKANGQDVGGVAAGKASHLLQTEHLLAKDDLLVIRHHNDQGDIEYVLKPSTGTMLAAIPAPKGRIKNPLGEGKGHHMAQMHAVAAGTATRVQEERLAFLMACQNPIEVAMGEDQLATEEGMQLVAGDSLKALQQRLVNKLRAKGVDQAIIVDGLDLAVDDLATDAPRIHILGGRLVVDRKVTDS